MGWRLPDIVRELLPNLVVPQDCREDLPRLSGGENGQAGHAAACWHPLASADELLPVGSP